MMSQLLLILSLSLAFSARADLSRTVEIERNLTSRVSNAIHPVDPDALISVKVILKDVRVKLPGVNVDYFGPTSVNKIFGEDVESIKVRVTSKLEPFPDWLRSNLQEDLKFGSVRTDIEIGTFSPEVLEMIRQQSPMSRLMDSLLNYSGGLWPLALLVLAVFFALTMTAVAAFTLWFMSFWRGQMGRITQALESASGGSAVAASAEIAREEPKALFKGSGHDLDIPDAGLTELLADCYWTEMDGYARWIWDQLKSKQREQVLSVWSLMQDYAKYLQSVSSIERAEHNHPYYLRPLALKYCDQKDLSQAVLKKPDLWHHLSPARRSHLEIPIAKRMEIVNSPVKDVSFSEVEKIKSRARKLSQMQFVGHLTLEDEAELWSNPGLVPAPLRPAVPTMIWVALLNKDRRSDLFSGYSAADLARCWVGPDEVLAALRESLPEKKLRLIEGYLQNLKPNRETGVFTQITSEAARQLNAQESKDDGKQAA